MRYYTLAALAASLFASASSAQDHEQSLIWGTYRPNLYFGLKPRLPDSLMTGLIWFGTQDYQSFVKARHACSQDDALDSYTYTHHDPRQGAIQEIKDSLNNVHLTIEWLKVPGGEHGGSWAARIKGKPLDQARPLRISLLWYLGVEGLGGIELENDEDENGLEGPIKFSGTSQGLGDFTMRIVDGPDAKYIVNGAHAKDFTSRLGKTHYLGVRAPPGNLWQAKDILLQKALAHAQEIIPEYNQPDTGPPDPSFVLQLPDETYSSSNLFAIQKILEGNFEFDIFYESASSKQKLDASTLTQGISAFKHSFENRFEDVFPIIGSFNDSYRAFSQDITANLFGGVGYFYGDSIIDHAFVHEWDRDESEDFPSANTPGKPTVTEPKHLLTATPSRSFFPRGFYWDEGFHLIHIGEWDNDFSLEILRDWFNLMNEDGWIGREQILGEEARSKVPSEFVAQYPTYANPPTLTMAVTALIKRLRAASTQPSVDDLGMNPGMQVPMQQDGHAYASAANRHLESPALAQEFLVKFYPNLKRHYEWFRRTQRGQIKSYGRKARSRTEAYRWRGRSATHVLTSGMDDYPRGLPHAGELHLDLISWMGFFSRTMKDIASFMGNTEDAEVYAETEKAIIENIDDLHWNEQEQMYCDVNVNADDESYHECHRGYLSIFPLILGLLPPTSPHVGPVLDLMRSPTHLWSDYGLRSLSAAHDLFGKDENYWRGNIWIQMNYLALSSLYNVYMVEPGPFQKQAREIYTELRMNIIQNTFKEYQRTGYVWEQYDAISGMGSRSHPFTGWSSLVALILSEKYS